MPPASNCLVANASNPRFEPFSSCEFSECGKFRHWLVRIWREPGSGPMGCIIGKNPSQAGRENNDATMHKDISFGKSWGWRGELKVNLCDRISTDPQDLLAIPYSSWVSDNGTAVEVIKQIQRWNVEQVVCAWGTASNRVLSQRFRQRGDLLKRELQRAGIELFYLKLNADGTPAHTLYLPPSLTPQIWM